MNNSGSGVNNVNDSGNGGLPPFERDNVVALDRSFVNQSANGNIRLSVDLGNNASVVDGNIKQDL